MQLLRCKQGTPVGRRLKGRAGLVAPTKSQRCCGPSPRSRPAGKYFRLAQCQKRPGPPTINLQAGSPRGRDVGGRSQTYSPSQPLAPLCPPQPAGGGKISSLDRGLGHSRPLHCRPGTHVRKMRAGGDSLIAIVSSQCSHGLPPGFFQPGGICIWTGPEGIGPRQHLADQGLVGRGC